ncbi:interleukin-17 receptor E isoform X5 [Sciurus carolinensis]|uniref:interleukin-17 receptor E isoform X5 n=1 Tax=Sciurus carolinensis TaxID=30640 RepID=UPI001FB38313|nr:interleukin-17 receptor E isoform X5 [Sciurus carolinensis]
MGSPRRATLVLPLVLLLCLSASSGIGCPHLPHWITRCLLASSVDRSFPGSSVPIPCHCKLVPLLSTKPWHVQVWHWPCCLCLHLVSDPSGLQRAWFHLLLQKSKKSYKFKFSQRHRMPASSQRKLLGSCTLFEKDHHTSIPSPDLSQKGLRSKRTQHSDPEVVDSLPRPGSQRNEGPEFSFDFLPEARVIRVTIPPGPEVSMRLCHQWALECEELSSPFDAQLPQMPLICRLTLTPEALSSLPLFNGDDNSQLHSDIKHLEQMATEERPCERKFFSIIIPGGHTADLPYEFLLPCLCMEASYLQEDTVRRKKCPFQSQPEAYGSDFWKSVHFTDYSQSNQMVMALTLRCPLKLEASLCQRQHWHGPCEDLPNATAQESEGWYILEKVDLHPQLCFKFSFENSSHVECPHQSDPGLRPSGSGPHHSLPEDRGLCPGVEVRCPVCLEAPLVSRCLSQTPGALDPGIAGPHHPTGRCSGLHLPAPTARPGPSTARVAPARSGLRSSAAPSGSFGRTAADSAGRRARCDRGPVGGDTRGARGPTAVALGGAGARGAGTGHSAATVELRGPWPRP